MVLGTLRSTPPTALTSRGKPLKSTTMTWFTSMPRNFSTVWTAADGPPQNIAVLILSKLPFGSWTRVSRGIESWLMVCVLGLKRMSMMVSERAISPVLLSTPRSSRVVPLRQIQPLSAVSCGAGLLVDALVGLVDRTIELLVARPGEDGGHDRGDEEHAEQADGDEPPAEAAAFGRGSRALGRLRALLAVGRRRPVPPVLTIRAFRGDRACSGAGPSSRGRGSRGGRAPASSSSTELRLARPDL